MARKKTVIPKVRSQEEELALVKEDNKFLPFPPEHRICKVGQRVKYGAHPNTEVLEVFDNGKFIKAKVWGDYQHYSNWVYEEKTTFLSWVDILPIKEDTESLIQNTDIKLDYAHYSIDSLLHVSYHSGINMTPDYQRDYVWNDEDNIALIDSIFNNRTIGTHILVWLPFGFEHHFEVLDGKQRINALVQFFEDRFKYKGKYFSELNFHDQKHFEHYLFPRAEIRERNETEVSLEKKIKIFLHVNSMGKVMDKEHLEKVKAMLK